MRSLAPRSKNPFKTDTTDTQAGLFRQEGLLTGPAGTVRNLFADLRHLSRGQIIGEDLARHLQGARVPIDRTQGEGLWEFYRLDHEVYIVAADGMYDTSRCETVPGEGFVEFHLRLAGTLEMALPGNPETITVTGPELLILYQPPGVDITEHVTPKVRDSGVSLYCRPSFLAELAQRSGIAHWKLLEELEHHDARTAWYRQCPLSPSLMYIGQSLLANPYRRGVRLLHAEAKALGLICEILAMSDEGSDLPTINSESENRQLHAARRMLATHLSAPLKLSEIARAIGMSESKLKRTFKASFGTTVSDYGLECRMRHALELLRCKRMSVGQVAYVVGYRHQTSFTAAFQEFFGFLPSKARTGMH